MTVALDGRCPFGVRDGAFRGGYQLLPPSVAVRGFTLNSIRVSATG